MAGGLPESLTPGSGFGISSEPLTIVRFLEGVGCRLRTRPSVSRHPITSYGRLMDEQFGLFWIHLGFAAIVGLIMLLFVV